MVAYTFEQLWEILPNPFYDFGKKKKKTIFSDEAHFDLGGYINKQNCRIWVAKKESLFGADFGP